MPPLETTCPELRSIPAGRTWPSVVVAPRQAHPDPEWVRRAVQDDVLGGATGLFFQFSRACRFGLDADHPAALEHLAEGGTSAGTAGELTTALALGAHHVEVILLDAGANAVPALALTEAALARLRIPRERPLVCAGFDPAGALLRDGALPADLDVLWAEVAEAARAPMVAARGTKLVTADGSFVHNAGADAALELAVLWGSAIDSFDHLTDLGMAPYDAAHTIVFRTAVGRDVFTEVAKLRALRLGWAKLLKAAGLERAPAPVVHACVSARMLARRDPWVNVLRGAGSLWSAIVGGADVVTPAPWDEPIGEPDAVPRRIARNQALVLLEESAVAHPEDPAAGSYALEHLTAKLGEAAWAHLAEFERGGGLMASIEAGQVQSRVREAAALRSEAVARRQEPIVGVGEYPNLDEPVVVRREVRDRKSATSLADLAVSSRRLRASSPPPAFGTRAAFGALVALAEGGATVSELGRALSRRGDGPAVERVRPMRDSARFERLRDRIERLSRSAGSVPRLTLVTLGAAKECRARVAYAEAAFAVAGFRTTVVPFSELPVGDTGRLEGAACLCTSDAVLASDGVLAARTLRTLGASPLLVAGKVPALEAALTESGVTLTLFHGCDLGSLLEKLVLAEESRR